MGVDSGPAGSSRGMTGDDSRHHPDAEYPDMTHRNTICLWFDGTALDAATFYAQTFPDSAVTAVHRAPGDFPSGKEGDVLTVEFSVLGIPCIGLNGGPAFRHSEAFSFQVATEDQAETVGRHRRQRRPGKRLRLVQGPVGPVLADHPARAERGHRRPRPRRRPPRLRGDDGHAQDRYRDDRGSEARLTPPAPGQRTVRAPAPRAPTSGLPASVVGTPARRRPASRRRTAAGRRTTRSSHRWPGAGRRTAAVRRS